jgi:hypothetical protein
MNWQPGEVLTLKVYRCHSRGQREIVYERTIEKVPLDAEFLSIREDPKTACWFAIVLDKS